MNTEEHDDLWRLLGKAQAPSAGPFFARNVLRAIRAQKQSGPAGFAWLRRHWQLSVFGTCATVVAVVALSTSGPTPERADQTTLLLAEKVSKSIDYQVITNLDELIASEENLAWLEN